MFDKRCSNCEYLDLKKKQAGAGGGHLYFCQKLNAFINPSEYPICDAYDKDWDRKSEVADEIDDDSKKYDTRDTNIIKPFIILFLVILLGILAIIVTNHQ